MPDCLVGNTPLGDRVCDDYLETMPNVRNTNVMKPAACRRAASRWKVVQPKPIGVSKG